MTGPRTLLLLLLVVILCFTDCEAARKKKCKYNGKKYKAGGVIDNLEDNCVELKCSEEGKKIELKLIDDCNCGGEVTDGPSPTDPVTDGPSPTEPSGGSGGSDCNCDYSTFSSSHTMNKYSGPDSEACGDYSRTGVTEDEIETILKTHNDLREKVAKGSESDGAPGPQPGATNMYELKWNCELAEVAQRWAERCEIGHDSGDDRKICNQDYYVGQNAYMKWDYDPASYWESAITNWYNEVQYMPNTLVGSFGSPSSGKTIGHYTQVVWAETFEVGCGAIYFPDTVDGTTYPESKVYVCNYGSGGNIYETQIYETGTAASNCPNGASSDYPGLCVPPS